jgi:hypothetical protein
MADSDAITLELFVIVCVPDSVSPEGVPTMDPPPERLLKPMTMQCCSDDPFMVNMLLHAPVPVSWRFARDILRDAMTKRVRNDGISAGPVNTPDGDFTALGTVPYCADPEDQGSTKSAVVYAANEPLSAFLNSTYEAYPAGEELAKVDVDAELAELLKE